MSGDVLKKICPVALDMGKRTEVSEIGWMNNAIQTGFNSVTQFKECWIKLATIVNGTCVDDKGALAVSPSCAGYLWSKKEEYFIRIQSRMQSQIQNVISAAFADMIKDAILDLPRFSEARMAVEAVINCPIAKRALGIFDPPARVKQPSRELQLHVFSRFLGAPSPLARPYIGTPIMGNHGKQFLRHPPDKEVPVGAAEPPAVSDKGGYLAGNLVGLGTFDTRTRQWHNPVQQMCIKLAKKYLNGSKVTREPMNLFRTIPTTVKHKQIVVTKTKQTKKKASKTSMGIRKKMGGAPGGNGSSDGGGAAAAVVIGDSSESASDDKIEIEDTSATSQRQLKRALRHGKHLTKITASEKHKRTLNKKIYVPDFVITAGGISQAFDVKTRGFNKTNFPIEHPASSMKKGYKTLSGKVDDRKATWNTHSTFTTYEKYRNQMVDLD